LQTLSSHKSRVETKDDAENKNRITTIGFKTLSSVYKTTFHCSKRLGVNAMPLKEIIYKIMQSDQFWTVTDVFERLPSDTYYKRPDVFAAMHEMVANDVLIKEPNGKDSVYSLGNYDPSLKVKEQEILIKIEEELITDIPAEFNRLDEALRQIELRKEDKRNADAHYQFSYKGHKIDPYRIFRIYNIAAPEQQHAIKKLLRAGKSVKTLDQDIDEVILTLQRWKEILKEDVKLN
jgi:hypothetical protein